MRRSMKGKSGGGGQGGRSEGRGLVRVSDLYVFGSDCIFSSVHLPNLSIQIMIILHPNSSSLDFAIATLVQVRLKWG